MAASVSKAILLDVDGVIMRHPPTLAKVSHRIDKFVAKTMGVSNVHGAKINHRLYKTFGHTYLGLRTMYPQTGTLQNFNEFVYTDDVLQKIHDSTYNVDVIEHIIQVQRFLSMCKESNIPVYMFSNAPRIWCETVNRAYNLGEWIPDHCILSSEHDLFRGHLKPNPDIYSTLQQYLCFEYKNEEMKIVYVDDSFVNLVPIMGNSYWKPILFESQMAPFQSPKIYHASSFSHIRI